RNENRAGGEAREESERGAAGPRGEADVGTRAAPGRRRPHAVPQPRPEVSPRPRRLAGRHAGPQRPARPGSGAADADLQHMSDWPAPSLTLLQRARARQPAAWERLVALYAPLVLHWCRRAGLGDADAADVFQEVFRSVSEHLNEFRRDRPGDTFRGWLRTI